MRKEVTSVSQLLAGFGLWVQSHSQLCSITGKAKSDQNPRPLRLHFLLEAV